MKQFLLFTVSIIILASCSSNTEEKKDQEVVDPKVEDQTTNFDDTKFKNKVHSDLLNELDICVLSDTLGVFAECSPQNFKIIPFKNDTDVKNAFILEMKSGIRLKNSATPLPPVRHIVVFERVDGELVKVNGFRGDIIATQKGKKADDLILALYLTEDETLFHCLYEWDGERYMFKSIEGLDYGEGVRSLSAATKDSMTQLIYADIIKSKLVY